MYGCALPGVRLQGTHGRIFAWDPPSFGIPAGVLETLAEKLKVEVVELALNRAAEEDDDASRQSSPQSGTESLPEHQDEPEQSTLEYMRATRV